MPVTEYETKRIEVKGKGFDKKLKSALNEQGKDRWELCGIRELKRSITCIFKRKVIVDDKPDSIDVDERK